MNNEHLKELVEIQRQARLDMARWGARFSADASTARLAALPDVREIVANTTPASSALVDAAEWASDELHNLCVDSDDSEFEAGLKRLREALEAEKARQPDDRDAEIARLRKDWLAVAEAVGIVYEAEGHDLVAGPAHEVIEQVRKDHDQVAMADEWEAKAHEEEKRADTAEARAEAVLADVRAEVEKRKSDASKGAPFSHETNGKRMAYATVLDLLAKHAAPEQPSFGVDLAVGESETVKREFECRYTQPQGNPCRSQCSVCEDLEGIDETQEPAPPADREGDDARRGYTFRLSPQDEDRCHDCRHSRLRDGGSASCSRLGIEIECSRKSRCDLHATADREGDDVLRAFCIDLEKGNFTGPVADSLGVLIDRVRALEGVRR